MVVAGLREGWKQKIAAYSLTAVMSRSALDKFPTAGTPNSVHNLTTNN